MCQNSVRGRADEKGPFSAARTWTSTVGVSKVLVFEICEIAEPYETDTGCGSLHPQRPAPQDMADQSILLHTASTCRCSSSYGAWQSAQAAMQLEDDEYLEPINSSGTQPGVTPGGTYESTAFAASLPAAQAVPESRACHPVGMRTPRGSCTHEQLHALQQQRLGIQAAREAARDRELQPKTYTAKAWQHKVAAEREGKLASACLQAQHAELAARDRATRAEADKERLLREVAALRASSTLDAQTSEAISRAVAAAMSHPSLSPTARESRVAAHKLAISASWMTTSATSSRGSATSAGAFAHLDPSTRGSSLPPFMCAAHPHGRWIDSRRCAVGSRIAAYRARESEVASTSPSWWRPFGGSARGSASGMSARDFSNTTSTIVTSQAKAFPEYADNGVPGPGSYHHDVPLGRQRSAPKSPPEPPAWRARGTLRLPMSLASGVTVHGTLPDSTQLQWRRKLARAEGVAAMRGHRGASVMGEALSIMQAQTPRATGTPRARTPSALALQISTRSAPSPGSVRV